MTLRAEDKLTLIRTYMEEKGLDALIVPTADPHLSEYLYKHYASREWLTGFTGSTGDVIVAKKEAALFTDSRYWIQAERQLADTGISLIKAQGRLISEENAWLRENLSSGSSVGVPAAFISAADADILEKKLQESGIKLVLLEKDPFDAVWKEDRPEVSFSPIFEHKISPRSVKDKIGILKPLVEKEGAQKLLLTSLEDIAWLTNLRGNDLPETPVFYSFGMYDVENGLTIFVNEKSISVPLALNLVLKNVNFRPYEEFSDYLSSLDKEEKVLYSPSTANALIAKKLQKFSSPIKGEDIVELLRARKTPQEVKLIDEAMLKDGVALAKFFCWLDKNKDSGELTEESCAEKLLEFRKEQTGFLCSSFKTICAFGPNAALPHYQPNHDKPVKIQGSGFLLIDSGAQYPEGTTDITRTVPIGDPSEQMKADYTAVLRGHINLAKLIFPENISSQILDTAARAPIWEDLADYGHGTGHGVGFFLNVHEGPQRISYPRVSNGVNSLVSYRTQMKKGMITSNEPGLYREGKWGIRIENLTVAIPAGDSEFGSFLGFRTLSLCPIDLTLVNSKLFQTDEINWLNAYHSAVWKKLSPLLIDDIETQEWLKAKTSPVC